MPSSGTQTVNPTSSTNYHLVARGDGGSADATTRVTVNPPMAPAAETAPAISDDASFRQNVADVFFDYDSYDISAENQSVIMKDATYLTAHPNIKVVIGGYCDERGSTEYNLALGENRASAVKKALIADRGERRPHPYRQLREREAVLHRARRKLLAAEPPRAVLDRPVVPKRWLGPPLTTSRFVVDGLGAHPNPTSIGGNKLSMMKKIVSIPLRIAAVASLALLVVSRTPAPSPKR